MINRYSPSPLISAPPYLPNSTRSPACTSSGWREPSSLYLPRPAAITSPSWGFSFAVSGMMMPPRTCSPSSMRLTITRSCSGWILVVITSFDLLLLFATKSGFCEAGNWSTIIACVDERPIVANKQQGNTLNFLVVELWVSDDLAGPEGAENGVSWSRFHWTLRFLGLYV